MNLGIPYLQMIYFSKIMATNVIRYNLCLAPFKVVVNSNKNIFVSFLGM